MDYAGALGFSTLVLFMASVVLTIVSSITFGNVRGRAEYIAFLIMWVGIGLIGLCVISFIVAIWMGYAQGAA